MKIEIASFSITHIGSDWLLGSHSACHVDTQNLTTTHFFPFPTQLTCPFPIMALQGFSYQKTKQKQSIFMKTFVVFTSCKVTLSSGRGCLNTPRVFDLAAKLGFLVFLFFRDLFSTKGTAVFQGKRKRTWKNKNGTANESRLQRQTHSLG